MADEQGLEGIEPDRRTFIKRIAIGAAFAVPVVSSFSMSGLSVTGNTAGAIPSNLSGIPSDLSSVQN